MDRLSKGAAPKDGRTAYDKITSEVVIPREEEKGLNTWQKQWANMGKGAVTKVFIPSVRSRLRMKIRAFPEFTAVATGHGAPRSYLHKFGLTDKRQ